MTGGMRHHQRYAILKADHSRRPGKVLNPTVTGLMDRGEARVDEAEGNSK